MNVGNAFMQSPLTSVSVPPTPVIRPSDEGHICMLRRTIIKESNNDSILPTQISAENPNVGVAQVVLRPPYKPVVHTTRGAEPIHVPYLNPPQDLTVFNLYKVGDEPNLLKFENYTDNMDFLEFIALWFKGDVYISHVMRGKLYTRI